MPAPADLYAVLGVARTASEEELKAAWRALARRLHPDRHPDDPGAAGRLGEVNAAYSVLADPKQRAQYDRYGPDAASAFFDPALARASERERARVRTPTPRPVEAGKDLEVEFSLDAAGARYGGPQDVIVQPPRRCTHCGGTGWRRAGRACSKCEGGSVPGIGPFRVNIPAGVVDGQVLVLPGSGRGGRGRRATPGDLRITLRVAPVFIRKAHEVYVDVPCSEEVLQAGGKVRVPLPSGRAVRMTVPAGSRHGRALRLRGKGQGGTDLVAVLVAGPTPPRAVQAIKISVT